jgi:hypothetical protein
MKLKLILGIAGLTNISRIILAADPTVPYITYTTNSYAPLNYSASNSVAISASNAVALGLNAQTLLLKDLIQDHQKRATALTQASQNDKAKWETDLVNELQEKNARLQKSIDQATQPPPGTTGLKAGSSDVDDQLAFVSTVEAGLEQTRQELAAAIEDSRALAMQVATNKAPEDYANLSFALGENQKLVKRLQKEQLDFELRKLEFRAILKVMQK